jgi:hypothetical protein
MLTEIANPRQIEGEGRRRWFTDSYFDLIVWHDRQGEPTGFQLCYDKGRRERAVSWRQGEGFSHELVDDGEVTGRMKMTPVLVPDGIFHRDEVTERFWKESEGIDPRVRRFVYSRLLRHPG